MTIGEARQEERLDLLSALKSVVTKNAYARFAGHDLRERRVVAGI
jgi:hypothetical protein